MASISTDARGNRRILFVDIDGRRKPIRVGKMSMKATEAIKVRVEHLIAAKGSGCSWDLETSRWVGGIGDELASKLSAVGLIPRRERADLGTFLASYIQDRKADVKPSTLCNLRQAERLLLEYFTAAKRLQDISLGDADEFRRWVGTKIGDNTARRMLGRAKQFFRAALRKRLISENPFGDMKGLTVQPNKAREFFVTREMADKITDACPDTQWRLLFCLARWGGLRTPSEPLALTWGDVDWGRNRLRISSVKTEHHEGHGERWIPIFPELRPHLEAAWDAAPKVDPTASSEEKEAVSFIITRYRNRNSNLRTQLERIAGRAGVEMWGKPFQNCRSSRETELSENFPIHVVCAWLGNSPKVAAAHYLQVTDEHFSKAAQKQAQQPPETPSKAEKSEGENITISDVCKSNPLPAIDLAPRQGLEPWTLRLTVARSTN